MDCGSRIAALFMLVASAPLFLLIGAAVLLSSGRPILYRGDRLGRGMRRFKMYKFRTLRPDAEKVIGGRLLSGSMDLTTPFGRWLRETRLDELPQLINVLKGDMAFLGPRPERPAVYEAQCRSIPGYSRRFAVKPGLVGYAQVFTPHGTPKAVRARIDNLLASKPRSEWQRIRFVAYAAGLVGMTAAGRALAAVRALLKKVVSREEATCIRKLPRTNPAGATARLGSEPGEAKVMDINETAVRLRSDRPLFSVPEGQVELRVRVRGRNGRLQTRVASCRGILRQIRESDFGIDYVVAYEPVTPVSDYNIQQYFLDNSIAGFGRV